MRHILDVITNIYVIAVTVIISFALLARITVFCYWWVVGAWEDEQCEQPGGSTVKQARAKQAEAQPVK